jgi:hypothetical protein
MLRTLDEIIAATMAPNNAAAMADKAHFTPGLLQCVNVGRRVILQLLSIYPGWIEPSQREPKIRRANLSASRLRQCFVRK